MRYNGTGTTQSVWREISRDDECDFLLLALEPTTSVSLCSRTSLDVMMFQNISLRNYVPSSIYILYRKMFESASTKFDKIRLMNPHIFDWESDYENGLTHGRAALNFPHFDQWVGNFRPIGRVHSGFPIGRIHSGFLVQPVPFGPMKHLLKKTRARKEKMVKKRQE